MASADILRAAHSDLPWRASEADIFDAEGEIATVNGEHVSYNTDLRNAAFIVRACNAHYQMLEALKALDAWWTDSFPAGPDAEDVSYGFGKLSEDTLVIWRQVRAAIAAAEAEAGR